MPLPIGLRCSPKLVFLATLASLLLLLLKPRHTGPVDLTVKYRAVLPKRDGGADDRKQWPKGGQHVVSTFFKGKYSAERLEELVATAYNNACNKHIAAVHYLWEDVDPLPLLFEYATTRGLRTDCFSKIWPVHFPKQPTYKDLFTFANTLEPGTIVLQIQADMHFDDTLGCLTTRDGKLSVRGMLTASSPGDPLVA